MYKAIDPTHIYEMVKLKNTRITHKNQIRQNKKKLPFILHFINFSSGLFKNTNQTDDAFEHQTSV